MTALIAVTIVLQLVVPLTLLWGVAFDRAPGSLARSLDVVAAGAYVTAIAWAGLWLALPWYLPWIYLAVLVAAAVSRLRTLRVARNHRGGRLSSGLRWSLVILSLGLAGWAAAGRRPPNARAFDLSFPLSEGTYLVAAGGSNGLVNPHLKTLRADRYAAYRGQSYAVDLVAIGGWGSRVASPFSSDLQGYEIFGHAILAPCSGLVVAAVDGLPDRHDRPVDRKELEGNHVILDCAGTWIVMAHMKRGSVVARSGARVARGEPLGRVGNSGQSDEPHLHVHAQTPGTRSAPLGGDPIPVTFTNAYLVRNDRIPGMHGETPTRSTRAERS